jgi:hypothetical protein
VKLVPFFILVIALGLGGFGCAKKPTMKVNHAEVSGVQLGFPPSLAIQMTVVLDVFNPNSYDVAVRAMRGNVTFQDQYSMPIDFKAAGDGVWLPASQTTQVRVPVAVPVDLALRITHGAISGTVPYHVVGKADVTATKSLKIEKDDYSVDEKGELARNVIEQSIASMGIPLLR